MTLHPTTAILLDRERRRDLERLATPVRNRCPADPAGSAAPCGGPHQH